jgi:hypothetical protein
MPSFPGCTSFQHCCAGCRRLTRVPASRFSCRASARIQREYLRRCAPLRDQTAQAASDGHSVRAAHCSQRHLLMISHHATLEQVRRLLQTGVVCCHFGSRGTSGR